MIVLPGQRNAANGIFIRRNALLHRSFGSYTSPALYKLCMHACSHVSERMWSERNAAEKWSEAGAFAFGELPSDGRVDAMITWCYRSLYIYVGFFQWFYIWMLARNLLLFTNVANVAPAVHQPPWEIYYHVTMVDINRLLSVWVPVWIRI